LAATDLVFVASSPVLSQGIGPMSQSKSRESPSRKKHRRIRKAQARIGKVSVEAGVAAKPVPAPEVVHPHAAAIDVHSDNHVVCVGPNQVQTFGAYTVDLHALADHLKQHGVTTVVLESTGVYWVPLFELLASRGFEVFLIEPSQGRHCGARPKTDVADCQWLQRLHTYGLLRPSFRPPESVLALRGYWRQRQMQVRYAASHVQHVQKALEQMNVKLTEVAADIMGMTGTRIIEAILKGERDAKKLASLRDPSCKKTEEEYAKALEGTWRPEHLFALKQAFALYQFHHQQITECDQRVAEELARLPNRAADKQFQPRPRRCGRKSNEVRFNATEPLFKALGVDLTLIDGIEVNTALVILAEIGVDVSRFPTEKHFASWLRLSPQLAQSNQTQKKRSPRRGKSRLAQALRMAAQAVSRTKTPLAMFYHRIKGRLGGKGAITATAHKLAVLVYRLLKYGVEYVRQSLEEYAAKVKEQMERSLRRKAALLGYELVPKTPAAQPS
jgi:transposase